MFVLLIKNDFVLRARLIILIKGFCYLFNDQSLFLRALNITPLRCLNNYFLLLLTFNSKGTFNKGSPQTFQDQFVLSLIFTGRWLLASPPKLSGKNRFRRVFINSPVVFLLFIGNTRKPCGKVNKSSDTKKKFPKKAESGKVVGVGVGLQNCILSKWDHTKKLVTWMCQHVDVWTRWCFISFSMIWREPIILIFNAFNIVNTVKSQFVAALL